VSGSKSGSTITISRTKALISSARPGCARFDQVERRRHCGRSRTLVGHGLYVDGAVGIVINETGIALGLVGSEIVVIGRHDARAGRGPRQAQDAIGQTARRVPFFGREAFDQFGVETEQAWPNRAPRDLAQEIAEPRALAVEPAAELLEYGLK
jgi:hypothetical protein